MGFIQTSSLSESVKGGGGRIKPGSKVAKTGDGTSLQSRDSTVRVTGMKLGEGVSGVVGEISFWGLPGRSISGTRELRPICVTLEGISVRSDRILLMRCVISVAVAAVVSVQMYLGAFLTSSCLLVLFKSWATNVYMNKHDGINQVDKSYFVVRCNCKKYVSS